MANREWKDRAKWAGASTVPMWFGLLVYGGGALAVFIRRVYMHWAIIGDALWLVYLWGFIVAVLCIYNIVIIYKARREMHDIQNGESAS